MALEPLDRSVLALGSDCLARLMPKAKPQQALHGAADSVAWSAETERALPALERLVDASTPVPVRKRNWAQLAEPERASLRALGADQASWDAMRSGDLSKTPSAFKTAFEDLPHDQQRAARTLGFQPEDWNGDRASRADLQENPTIGKAFATLMASPGTIDETAVRKTLLPAARQWGIESPSAKRALLYVLDFHGNRFTDSARRAIRDEIITQGPVDQLMGRFPDAGWNASIAPQPLPRAEAAWKGLGPQIVNDASGLSPTMVRDVVHVRSVDDVRSAIAEAKRVGAKISIAGRRHSEGGQSAAPGSINLDMMGLNHVQLLPDGTTARIEMGATWAQVQDELAKSGRAVKIMQTSNIFTVGGALSVNCHGRTPGEPPFISSVKSLRIMGADGAIRPASRTENPDLFRHAIGGYGLFGVVLDADLETVPNATARMHVEQVDEKDYLARLHEVAQDPGLELAYGRLSPMLDGKALLHVIRRTDAPAPAAIAGIEGDKMNEIAKMAFEASKWGPEFLEARWWLEAKLSGKDVVATRTEFMSPNVDNLRQYWYNEGKKTDILHEYFVPNENFQAFIDGLREIQKKDGLTSLNITLRDVSPDTESALPYAKKPSTAFVLYYNQNLDASGNAKQAQLQQDLIDLTERLGGTFYLPYQLNYDGAQLRMAYPEVDAFFAKKREIDPGELFTNPFYEKYVQPAAQQA